MKPLRRQLSDRYEEWFFDQVFDQVFYRVGHEVLDELCKHGYQVQDQVDRQFKDDVVASVLEKLTEQGEDT